MEMKELYELARREVESWPEANLEDRIELGKRLRMAQLFDQLIKELVLIDDAYLDKQDHPSTAEKVRTFAIMALSTVRSYLPSDFLPASLEILAVELSEVNAGRRSSLFQPGASEMRAKVRLTVRAASAAALHVLVQMDLASVEDGAALISDELFKARISRVNAAGEESPIPPATIIDWRKHREALFPEFIALFERFTDLMNKSIIKRGNDATDKSRIVIQYLSQLVNVFDYK